MNQDKASCSRNGTEVYNLVRKEDFRSYIFALQSQLGHNDPQTTKRFGFIFDDTLREEIDRMDRERKELINPFSHPLSVF